MLLPHERPCGTRRAQEASVTQQISGPSGHKLSVESLGDPEGKPVFLLHGTPGGRNGPRPRGIVLYRLGIRLISYDRPGYPGSDRAYGRTVADAAEDVRAIADHLGIDRFSVVGRSGGGPHALACAALLPHRVICAAALSSLAPRDAKGLDWEAGMAKSNITAFRYAALEPPNDLRSFLESQAKPVSERSEGLLNALRPEMDDDDKEVVDDAGLRQIIANVHVEALRDNIDGWMDDAIALGRPWGFDPDKIAVPVKLWGAHDDVFSPVSHTYWLAEQIEDAEVEREYGKAHFSSVKILPKFLAWAARKASTEQLEEAGHPGATGHLAGADR